MLGVYEEVEKRKKWNLICRLTDLLQLVLFPNANSTLKNNLFTRGYNVLF